jgi:hypothetical protein
MLRQPKRHGEQGVQQAGKPCRQALHRHAGPQIAAGISVPAGESAGRHDAFDAKIQHWLAADQFAHRGEDQREAMRMAAEPEGGLQENTSASIMPRP